MVDVARQAGVSVSTAARVLSRSVYPVTPLLQERVETAAERIGYVPNLRARGLRGSEATYIGLIVGNMLEPFFGEIAEAVTNEARLRGAIAIVSNMQRDPRLEIELCRQLWEHRVSGLMLAGGGFDQETHRGDLAELTDRMTRAGVIVVSLAERGLEVPSFFVPNEEVGAVMARCALDHGHRNVAAIFVGAKSRTIAERLDAIRATLHAGGARLTVVQTESGVHEGAEAVETALRQDGGITAFICGGDTLALDVLQRLQATGRRVPGDMSVIGIGNTSHARLASPPLCSVDVRVAECARAAVRHICDRIDGLPEARWTKPSVALIEAPSVGLVAHPKLGPVKRGRPVSRSRATLTELGSRP